MVGSFSAKGACYPGSLEEEHENQIFQLHLKLDDSYTRESVYWADLPFMKRAGFVGRTDTQEVHKELDAVRSMLKKNPLSPIGRYLRNAVLPGAGLPNSL
jgi:hypothetical protein